MPDAKHTVAHALKIEAASQALYDQIERMIASETPKAQAVETNIFDTQPAPKQPTIDDTAIAKAIVDKLGARAGDAASRRH